MGVVRVIGGEKKGFRLSVLDDGKLRPTASRVREALFDILADKVRDARFLDLFAGAGAIGIEALSRGARYCLFVERNAFAASVMRRNLEVCGLADRASIRIGTLPGALSRLAEEEPFDLAFVDPPYDRPSDTEVLGDPRFAPLLSRNARVVLEHRKSWAPPARMGILVHRRSFRYGDTVLSLFLPASIAPEEKVQV